MTAISRKGHICPTISVVQHMQNRACSPGLNLPVRALDFQKMEIKDRFTCTQCSGAFFRWFVTYRCGQLEKLLEKLAPFEKFQSDGKEEARKKFQSDGKEEARYYGKSFEKVGRELHSLHQLHDDDCFYYFQK